MMDELLDDPRMLEEEADPVGLCRISDLSTSGTLELCLTLTLKKVLDVVF